MIEINKFPIHDAELIGISITRNQRASNITVEILIHPDEPLSSLIPFGLSSRTCRITFEDCWHLRADFLGFISGDETIDNWELMDEPLLTNRIKDLGLSLPKDISQHQFRFSSGSTAYILATNVIIEDSSNAKGSE